MQGKSKGLEVLRSAGAATHGRAGEDRTGRRAGEQRADRRRGARRALTDSPVNEHGRSAIFMMKRTETTRRAGAGGRTQR